MSDTPPPVLVRPPTDEDATSIARLLDELGYAATPEQTRARLARVAGDEAYAACVAEVDGEAVGFLGLQRGWAYEHDRPFARIITLVVDARVRRRGVGARLVEFAKGWARERGVYVLMLNTNVRREEAHRFYESMGFNRTGYRYARALD
jgi:GNAT superfamily N-acetyltransferase